MGGPVQYKTLVADGLVFTGPGVLYSVSITSSTGAVDADIHDALTAVNMIANVAGSGSTGSEIQPGAGRGISLSTGCYIDMTGSVQAVIVAFSAANPA